jgi:hypothetical protein
MTLLRPLSLALLCNLCVFAIFELISTLEQVVRAMRRRGVEHHENKC